MKKRKIGVIGVGMVGMSYVYSIVNKGFVDEIFLIDINNNKAKGEAMDISHSVPFLPKDIEVYAGDYSLCSDADLIVITAGCPQTNDETRLDLLEKNTKVIKDIVLNITKSKFNGIILVASNPVDILTKVAYETSNLPVNQVFGSGTTLDTARIKYELAKYFNINTSHIHAYIIGEHGDSELPVWSKSYVGVKSLKEIVTENADYSMADLDEIFNNVKKSAYEIIECKGSTYYAIGQALTRITKAIFEDEDAILTVSTNLDGEYGHKDVFIGVPAIVNKSGIRKVQNLNLAEHEQEMFDKSVQILKEAYSGIEK